MSESLSRSCPPKCPPPAPVPQPKPCPPSCPCTAIMSIASSIAHEEDALACILEAECAKLNKVLCAYNDVETLIAVNTSVQDTLEQIRNLEEVLKSKLDAILPFFNSCM